MKKPLISIITVSYNAGNTIRKTIESILKQKFENYEYIIIDGFSTDNTNEIIREYIPLFKLKGINIIYISEKDNGIYDAMNKGANLANGVWINYMNADDSYYNDEVLKMIFKEKINNNIDILYGDVLKIGKDSKFIEEAKDIKKIPRYKPFCHQSSFIKSYLQKEYKFNIEYKICADYDLFLRLYLDKKIFKKIDIIISRFSLEGISNENKINTYKENMIIRNNYKIINKDCLLSKIKFLRFIIKYKLNF